MASRPIHSHAKPGAKDEGLLLSRVPFRAGRNLIFQGAYSKNSYIYEHQHNRLTIYLEEGGEPIELLHYNGRRPELTELIEEAETVESRTKNRLAAKGLLPSSS